jgi:hypothetical protein
MDAEEPRRPPGVDPEPGPGPSEEPMLPDEVGAQLKTFQSLPGLVLDDEPIGRGTASIPRRAALEFVRGPRASDHPPLSVELDLEISRSLWPSNVAVGPHLEQLRQALAYGGGVGAQSPKSLGVTGKDLGQ